MDNNIKIKLV